jgi:hypothetical protein
MENSTDLRQVWFPGSHSNVGGGYEDQEIADITLAWSVIFNFPEHPVNVL